MLTEAKNQIKIVFLSFRYNLMKEMTNRVTFITNVTFMILNNASFIIQWLVIFQLKDGIGDYQFNDVLALWALAASTYGLSHILFRRAYGLSDVIMRGKLDAYLVQPKNVLISVITSSTSVAAIGDLIYGYLIMFILHGGLKKIALFTYFTITGAIILTAFAVIVGSLSFWIVKGDMIANNLNEMTLHFSTYPDGIFKGIVKTLLYTVIPVGLVAYLPLKNILFFEVSGFLLITGCTFVITIIAFLIFHCGLKRYSSSNLMGAR